MKFNPRLRGDIGRYRDYVFIVEGKNDVAAMKDSGFHKVYAIHKTSVSLRERAEEIVELIDRKKDKICILTDLDKKGKKLYLFLKPIFQELGVKLDSSFRGLLIKAQLSHIEGIKKFIDKVDLIG